jgi:O-antigen/teichoic acid export membrane protein
MHRATVLRDRPWLASTLGSLLAITGIVTVSGWLLAGALHVGSHGALFKDLAPQLVLLGFAALPFFVWEQYGSALLTATDQIRVYNRAQVVGRTVGLALFAILITGLRWGVKGALVATLISQMVVALTGIRSLFKQSHSPALPDWATVKELLSGGCKLHLNAIGGFLYTSTDVLLIHRYRGAVETGYYQMAVQMSGVLILIPQAASMVLFSRVAREGPDAVWPDQLKVVLRVTAAMALVAALAVVAAPLMIPAVAGRAFVPSIGIFQLLVVGLIGMSFTTMLGPQWIGRGLLWQTAAVTIVGGTLNFCANCLLVPRYGMYGSAAATLGTYAFSLAINIGMAAWVTRRTGRALPAVGEA